MNKETILKSQMVSKYLKAIQSKGTKEQYEIHLTDFFTWLNKHPDSYLKDPRKLRIEDPMFEIDYLDGVEKDILEYYQSFDNRICERTKRPYAPLTKVHRIYTIKNFLEWNHVELSKKFWIDFNRKHNGATVVIDDISPTQEQVQKLVQLGDIREKSVITCQTSSGARIGEVLDLRLKDLKWSDYERYGVLLVEIRADNKGNKTRKTRITFFSEEAVRYLKVWLESERKKYLQVALQKSKNLQKKGYMTGKVKDDDRVFPFSTNTWRDNSWLKLLRHTDMDWKDNIGHYRFRTHSLRKYFKKMGGKYSDDLRDQLIGHKGFEQRYSDITDKEEFCNEIKKLEPYVTIFHYENKHTVEKVERLDQRLKEKDREIAILNQKINNLENRRSEDVVNALLHNPDSKAELMKIIFDEVEKREKNKKA